MDGEWQLQEAKGKLSQLIKRAAHGGAQVVTVHGKPTAVVVSAEEYARLTRRRGKLSAALPRPELAAEDLDFSRSRDAGRILPLDAAALHAWARIAAGSELAGSH